MNDCFIRLVLLVLGSCQLCSCSTKSDRERVVPPTEKKPSAVNEAASPSSSRVAKTPTDPYEGFPDNQPVVHRVRAGQPGKDGWRLATPTRGSFSVMLPGQFLDSMIKMPTTKGGIGVMHTVATKSADGVEFNVLQSEIIGEMPDENPIDGIVERFKKLGATLTRTNMILADLPAVRMRVKAQGVAAEIIHVDATNGYYMLAVQARPPQPDNPRLEADIERFFKSFKILNSEE